MACKHDNSCFVCKGISNFFPYCAVNSLNAKLNPICHLLALLGAHHILHVSRIRVNQKVTHLFEAQRHNPEGCRFDSRWSHLDFSLT